MTRTYRFNRPLSLLFLLPMLLLVAMLGYGLLREFDLLSFVLVAATLGIVVLILYFSLFRSLSIGPEGLKWKAPKQELELKWEEIRHYGIVKYRSFRFIYLSRSAEPPFEQAQDRIVTSPDTFVVQYRPKAWLQVKGLVKEKCPGLEPVFMERGR